MSEPVVPYNSGQRSALTYAYGLHVRRKYMEFEATLSSAFLKKSHFRRLFKRWWGFAIAFSMILVAVLTDDTKEGLGTISIIGLSAIGLFLIIYTAAWGQRLRMINDWDRKQGNHPVTYRLSENEIETESMIGSTKLKWSAFKKLRIHNLDTLLEFTQPGALTLPTNQLSKEVIDYLIDRFEANKLTIVNKLVEQGSAHNERKRSS